MSEVHCNWWCNSERCCNRKKKWRQRESRNLCFIPPEVLFSTTYRLTIRQLVSSEVPVQVNHEGRRIFDPSERERLTQCLWNARVYCLTGHFGFVFFGVPCSQSISTSCLLGEPSSLFLLIWASLLWLPNVDSCRCSVEPSSVWAENWPHADLSSLCLSASFTH